MNPLPSDAARAALEVRGARASSVIVQRIPPDAVEVFMDWQRGISAAAAEAPGYQTTEIYPPSTGQQEWVVVIHFDDAKCLQDWIDSPRRAEWLAKLPKEIHDFRLKTLPAGFGAWFAGLGEEGALPPGWKIALSVLVQLYPTVMVLALVVGPYLTPLGLAVAMLVSNILSIAILQWGVTPALNPLLNPWLRAKGERHRAYSLGGLVVIVLLLGGMAIVFRLVQG
jgi:antibiotic biosynthesis monooxygenase (ABM) superfamily enzyme